MEAVIIAGGQGTRLTGIITKKIPKALIKIGNKPVIEHQIILLRSHGIKDIWILLGYLADPIKDYFQDGSKWNVNIHYHQEKNLLGTAGALKTLKNKINKDFLVLSGDIMLDIDIKRFINWHKQKDGALASFIVHPNDHPWDSDLVEIDNKDRIVSLLKRPHSPKKLFRNLSIASIYIFSPKIFEYIPCPKKSDIEKDILPLLLQSEKKLYAYNTPEYIKDMGTPERLEQVNEDYVSGKISKLNLKNKRRAIFLDRDGVINEEVDQLSRLKDFKMYNFASSAVKNINNSECLVIIITNQPMIAKGMMTKKDLVEIHKKLETELGRNGAKIDAIYFCPHHPEKGFEGELAELKIKCDCRKPDIGLIKKAANDLNVDLKNSFFIGDSSRDAKTAENAGIKFIGVKTGYGLKDGTYEIKNNFPIYKNLLEAVNTILKNE